MAEPDGMMKRILDSDGVFYKLELRGAPELTGEEKRAILDNLYATNPRLFISRYFSYMTPEDCCLFDADDYDIAYFVKQIGERSRNSTSKNKHATDLRNLRYAELERLKKEGDYFSYPKMREREPLLFDKMIGKFLPEEEQVFLRPTIENESLSGLMMQFEESQIVSDRRKMQMEDSDFVNHEEDELPHGLKRFGKLELDPACPPKARFGQLALHAECRQSPEEDIENELLGEEVDVEEVEQNTLSLQENEMVVDSEDERDEEQLRTDFIDYMEQRFLQEQDAEFFDYPALYGRRYSKEFEKMRNQDIEDAYFEKE